MYSSGIFDTGYKPLIAHPLIGGGYGTEPKSTPLNLGILGRLLGSLQVKQPAPTRPWPCLFRSVTSWEGAVLVRSGKEFGSQGLI